MNSFHELTCQAESSSRRIADIIKDNGSIIIVGYLDADGIASSGLIGKAIHRKKGRFTIRILGGMTHEILGSIREDKYKFHILCELGRGLVNDIEEFLGNNWLLIDHHPIPQVELKHDNVFNAWQFGYDGSTMISTTGMTYFIALGMDKSNVDLSYLPIVAALGDRQDQGRSRSLTDLNRKIMDDAIEYGLITVASDFMLYGRETRPVHESLASTTTPHIHGLSGNRDACLATVVSAGIRVKNGDQWRTLNELTEEERKKLVEAIIPHFATSPASGKGIEELIGEVYTLEREDEYSPLRDAREFATVLNACGRMSREGIGVSLCFGDRDKALSESEKTLIVYRQTLNRYADEIILDVRRIVEEAELNLVIGDDLVEENMLGALSSILSGSPRYDGKVLLARTITKTGDLKLSARITPGMKASVNLGLIMREAAERCNGIGGGHDAAAGARIGVTRFQEFLKIVKDGLMWSGGSSG